MRSVDAADEVELFCRLVPVCSGMRRLPLRFDFGVGRAGPELDPRGVGDEIFALLHREAVFVAGDEDEVGRAAVGVCYVVYGDFGIGDFGWVCEGLDGGEKRVSVFACWDGKGGMKMRNSILNEEFEGM